MSNQGHQPSRKRLLSFHSGKIPAGMLDDISRPMGTISSMDYIGKLYFARYIKAVNIDLF